LKKDTQILLKQTSYGITELYDKYAGMLLGYAKSDYLPKEIDLVTYNNRNKFLKLMNREQKEVFCGIYHSGTTISKLAAELNTNEAFIRKTLKEAFAIIKRTS